MALKHIFGETPAIKILDFLIDHIGYDYSKTEITEHAGIGWTTINRHWGTLEEWNLVTPTRKIGRATLYKLNEENPIVSQLLEFDEVASVYMSERIAEQELRATAAMPVPAAAHSIA
jgi:DNA-binding transcriptional ArsR family regulator